MPNKLCAVIPVYRHGETAGAVVRALAENGISSVLVDDGNTGASKIALYAIKDEFPDADIIPLKKNGGKGAAVCAGLLRAHGLGYTHALQIDADGQHDPASIPFFAKAAAKHPDDLICGLPAYDATAPKSRETGRKITNFWVMLETLSMDIPDAMCGFRVYPLRQVCPIVKKGFSDYRMGFDIEILVRLHWAGVSIRFYPVKVIYTKNGISNFRMLRDNIAISKTHTLLFLGMIPRIPRILMHKKKGK